MDNCEKGCTSKFVKTKKYINDFYKPVWKNKIYPNLFDVLTAFDKYSDVRVSEIEEGVEVFFGCCEETSDYKLSHFYKGSVQIDKTGMTLHMFNYKVSFKSVYLLIYYIKYINYLKTTEGKRGEQVKI